MFLIEFRVRRRAEIGKEAVFHGRERKTVDVGAVDALPVQQHLAFAGIIAENAFHQCGFARAVFAEQADDFSVREIQVDIMEHIGASKGLIQVFNR